MQIPPPRQYNTGRVTRPVNSQIYNYPVFTGTPPKMPEFMRPYHERKDIKSLSTGKKAILILGGSSAIIALTAAAHILLPIAIAGLITFLGVLGITMATLKWLAPIPTTAPKGTTGMTKEQMAEACRYEKARIKYEHSQRWQKVKKFFGAS